jgi:hypothetical protein
MLPHHDLGIGIPVVELGEKFAAPPAG